MQILHFENYKTQLKDIAYKWMGGVNIKMATLLDKAIDSMQSL